MATGKKTFSFLGFVFGAGCLASLIASFASDRWVVSTETQVAGFKNLGLWAACFSKFRPPSWRLNKYYDGCWWIFDREMDEIRFYLVPPWFVATQTLVSLSLVFQLMTTIIMVVNAINCFPYSSSKDSITLGLSAVAAALHGLTGILLAVAVILFGVRADNSRTWLDRPDQNYLSWSFGLCVLAAFLAILAFMAVSLETYRLWWIRKNSHKPDGILSSDFNENSRKSTHRGQNQIYSMQESEKTLITKPANKSSVRDSYHLCDVRENRQRGRTNGYMPQNDRRQASRPIHHEKRLVSSGETGDIVDTKHSLMLNTTSRSQASDSRSQASDTTSKTQSSNYCRKMFIELSTDYEDSKKIQQPVLPEYIPKSKTRDANSKLEGLSDSVDDSDDYDISQPIKTRSGRKNKKSVRADSKKHTCQLLDADNKNRSDTGLSKHTCQLLDADNKNRSDTGLSKHTTKHKNEKNNTSDEHFHLKKHRRQSSKSRERSNSRHRSSSRHRSHSGDLNSSGTESCSDSDFNSTKSQLRGRHKNHHDSSRKNKSNHSQDRHKCSTNSSKRKSYKNSAEDLTVSLYVRKQQTKQTGDRSKSQGPRRSKSQDFMDTESLHSNQGTVKPRSSYPSYYEY